MIKGFKDFKETQAYGASFEQLPKGGYVCKIIGAKIIDGNYGQSVKVALDISEGEYAGYFQKRFDNNTREDKKWSCVYMLNVPKDDGTKEDGWTKRKFKTFTNALEDSNENYHFDWDETKFINKSIGVLFNIREYIGSDDKKHSATNAAQVVSVETIHNGNFTLPEDKLIPDPQPTSFIPHSEVNTLHGSDEIPF